MTTTLNEPYLALALVTCFDGEGAADENGAGGGIGGGVGGAVGAASAAAASATATDGGTPRLFSQEEMNRILAEDRRKHKAALEKTEQTYKELLATNQNLTAKEREALEENLRTVQGQLRTKEHQAAIEKKELEEAYGKKVSEADKRAKEWEDRYREETINRSLLDAAVAGDAFNPSLMVVQLRQMSKLVEIVDKTTGKPTGKFTAVVEFPDVDATTGEPTLMTRTPDEAVKRMKELPHLYGGLFKSNVVSGIGANSSTAGLAAGSNGRIDVRNLTPEQYREIREKNPELLGLRAKGRRR